ncbi:MAG: hypothetical protein WCF85_10285 [Rhodospirillaceae bacterium]
MTGQAWWDSAAVIAIGVVCAGLIVRRLMIAFSKNPASGCGSCAKCGPGETFPGQPVERP